jgi:hypothetical protein
MGSLTITSTEGDQITPSGWAVQLRRVEQDVASASADDRQEAKGRLDFVKRKRRRADL